MVDIDIVKYFNSIPHSQLLDFLDRRVTDGVIRRMIITKKGFLHSWPEAEGQGPVAHSLRLRSGIRRHVDT